jgi:hypothetical protein
MKLNHTQYRQARILDTITKQNTTVPTAIAEFTGKK